MLSMADEVPLIFTPDNEAYLGLPWVHELDLLISSSAGLSQQVGVSSRMTDLNDLQIAVSEVAPSVLSLRRQLRSIARFESDGGMHDT